jgi:prepilin-type N-terminal cleavage/methylation domain-containing protein
MKGLTLVELLLALSIMAILATVGVLNLAGYRQRQNLDLAAQEITNALRDAQQRSMSQEFENPWGIRFQGVASGKDLYHLFTGASFTAATSTYDLSPKLEFAHLRGGQTLDIVFSQVSGTATATQSIVIETVSQSAFAIVNVTAAGRISYFTGPGPGAGLVAYWKFDESSGSSALDSSGTDNTGTMYTAASTAGDLHTDSGKLLRGASFDGTDDYILISNSANQVIPAGNAAFSISLWFNPDTVTTTNIKSLMVNESYAVSGFRFGIGESTPVKLQFWSTESGGSISLTSATTINTGTWYHAVMAYTGSSATLYINGAAESTDSSGVIVSNTNIVYIAMAIGGKQYFDGLIDDVRIYNRALSAAEVAALYNASR